MAKKNSNKNLQDQVLAVATMRAEEMLKEKQKTLETEIAVATARVTEIEADLSRHLTQRADISPVCEKMADMVAAYNKINTLATEACLQPTGERELATAVFVHDENKVSFTLTIQTIEPEDQKSKELGHNLFALLGGPTSVQYRRTFVIKADGDNELTVLLAAHRSASEHLEELKKSSSEVLGHIADFSRYERKLRGRIAEVELQASEEGRKLLESILSNADSIQGLLADLS